MLFQILTSTYYFYLKKRNWIKTKQWNTWLKFKTLKIIRRIYLFPQIPREASRKCRRELAGLRVTTSVKLMLWLRKENGTASWEVGTEKILAHSYDVQVATAQDLQWIGNGAASALLCGGCFLKWTEMYLATSVPSKIVLYSFQKQLPMCNMNMGQKKTGNGAGLVA